MTETEKEIKKLQKELEKFLEASYDSEKRGYVINGKVYGKTELDTQIAKLNKSISDIKSKEKKATSESLKLGPEYERLIKAAINIKVTDYESSIENLRAWRNVQTYVENNDSIKTIGIKTKNPSIFEIATAWMRTGIGPKYVKVVKDVDPKNVVSNVQYAISLANGFAERDTTERKRVQTYGEPGAANATFTYKTDVTDEPTLSARQVEIDSIISGQEPPLEISTSARKGKQPVSKIVLNPVTKTGVKAKKTVTPAAPKYGTPRAFEEANKPEKAVTPGGGPLPSGGGLKKGQAIFDGKKVKVGGSKWQQIIQDEFGSMWDIYNDNPDVHKVIDQAVKEGWYNDETKLTARLQNTNWFRTTEASTREYNIKKSTDPASLASDIEVEKENLRAYSLKSGSGIVLSEASLNKLAEDKIKFGWSEQQTINAVGSESVATATSGGPQGTAALRQGSIASELRQRADDYAQKVDQGMLDKWTAEILSGTKTQDQFMEQMKMQASQQYRSLAPQIEKNQTVKEAVNMYSNQAQSILGIDPSTIDWTQDKWNSALNYKDPKTNEYRTMDAFEWNKHLRNLPEWQNTDDARTVYRDLAFSLVSGFGKKI